VPAGELAGCPESAAGGTEAQCWWVRATLLSQCPDRRSTVTSRTNASCQRRWQPSPGRARAAGGGLHVLDAPHPRGATGAQARSWQKHKASAHAYAQLAAETGLDLAGMRAAIKGGRSRRSAAAGFDALNAEFGLDSHAVREARAHCPRAAPPSSPLGLPRAHPAARCGRLRRPPRGRRGARAPGRPRSSCRADQDDAALVGQLENL